MFPPLLLTLLLVSILSEGALIPGPHPNDLRKKFIEERDLPYPQRAARAPTASNPFIHVTQPTAPLSSATPFVHVTAPTETFSVDTSEPASATVSDTTANPFIGSTTLTSPGTQPNPFITGTIPNPSSTCCERDTQSTALAGRDEVSFKILGGIGGLAAFMSTQRFTSTIRILDGATSSVLALGSQPTLLSNKPETAYFTEQTPSANMLLSHPWSISEFSYADPFLASVQRSGSWVEVNSLFEETTAEDSTLAATMTTTATATTRITARTAFTTSPPVTSTTAQPSNGLVNAMLIPWKLVIGGTILTGVVLLVQ
ncbi:uncharacterized protein BDR25DRAFT_318858 [Lindgomyces ingoldianus]|uniref:Uncharacterized protein n=1 Tax=Lindgomyces ingoldianus TaxID=673940 RepID=A0ACB6QD65_9PLEO|nr:uncharacterized protein BDR25DRAFT_318858 [Lindgomyces ingoldianus]KAF2464866.1 hypothetical protein BDR25DRAFT_318858 [Lindgomyces ingoldianus]